MTLNIVVTGGPCSGKTTTLTFLEQKGYHIIPEAATDIIRLMQAQGVKEPWNHKDFQHKVLDTQTQRLSRISNKVRLALHDRAPWDPIMYQKKLQPNDPCTEIEKKVNPLREHFGTFVFLMENLGFSSADGIRHEGKAEACDIEKRLEETYTEYNFEVIRIPMGTVEQRASRIMEELIERGIFLPS